MMGASALARQPRYIGVHAQVKQVSATQPARCRQLFCERPAHPALGPPPLPPPLPPEPPESPPPPPVPEPPLPPLAPPPPEPPVPARLPQPTRTKSPTVTQRMRRTLA